MAQQGACKRCMHRYDWGPTEIRLGEARCPECKGLLERTSRPDPRAANHSYRSFRVTASNVRVLRNLFS